MFIVQSLELWLVEKGESASIHLLFLLFRQRFHQLPESEAQAIGCLKQSRFE
jgi:hypothetical protein